MGDEQLRKNAAFRLPVETLAMLRLWCTMNAVDQASTVDTCIRMHLNRLLMDAGREFRDAFNAALDKMLTEPDQQGGAL